MSRTTAFKKGSELAPEVQRACLARFVHRFTGDHKPAWAWKSRPDGTSYPVHFANDADWLANTDFAVKADGTLDKRVPHCFSRPTWPKNPELRDGRAGMVCAERSKPREGYIR